MVGGAREHLKAIARDRRRFARLLERAQVAVARAELSLHLAEAALRDAVSAAPSAQIAATAALRGDTETAEVIVGRLRPRLWERIEEVGDGA